VCRMNHRVDQQVRACVHVKELTIDHVRNPSERMPVRRVKRGERPGESRAGHTMIHHLVFLDIRGVIESDELMPDHLRINRERHYCETQRDEEIGSPAFCTVAYRHGPSRVRCGRANSPSFLRTSFPHGSLRRYQTTNTWPP